jgi:hypothetical protein
MDQNQLLLACLGAISPVAFAGLAALAAGKLRSRRFRKFKSAPTEPPDFLPALPQLSPTPVEARLDETMRGSLHDEHALAKALQNRAFAMLVMASAGLLLAFVLTTASVTVLAASPEVHIFSAAADVTSFLLVGWTFSLSARVRAKWLHQRARVELVRQWIAVEPLVSGDPDSVAERLSAFEARVDAALDAKKGDLHARVAHLADCRSAEIEAGIAGNRNFSTRNLHHYIVLRPVRQVRWFSASRNRIDHQREGRRTLMLTLFGIAALAAVVKLAGIMAMGPHQAHALASLATLVLLVSIGLATALTSTFVGQSLRSIRHRYAMQMGSFRVWLERSSPVIDLARSGASPSDAERTQAAAAVAKFETLMLTELLDWITITGDDAMELAPI